ncbi:MAG: tetratricopeptide repeat protein [Nitrospiraceae bacterium]|nr:tetratricopeptide repeat protein [Nitrospiraceae bacterium]
MRGSFFNFKFNPDGLDKAALAGIVALCASIVVLTVFFRGGTTTGAAPASGFPGGAVRQAMPEEAGARIRQIENILNGGGNPVKAEALAKDALAKYPYEAEFYMLMGDVYMRLQKPVSAVAQYRQAVELNPDFTDKTSHSFEGGKIRVALREARRKLAALGGNPQNEGLKKAKSDIYYLMRRLAGSCG